MIDKNSEIDLKVAAKCVIKQETSLVVDEAGNKLPGKAVMMHKLTPFVITEKGNIDYFTGGKMENCLPGG